MENTIKDDKLQKNCDTQNSKRKLPNGHREKDTASCYKQKSWKKFVVLIGR